MAETRRRHLDDGRTAIVCVGALAKVIPLTWFERLGRAVLAGASESEIEALRQDHGGRDG